MVGLVRLPAPNGPQRNKDDVQWLNYAFHPISPYRN